MKSKLLYLFKAHFGRIILGMILVVAGGSFSQNGIFGSLWEVPAFDIPFFVMMAGWALVLFESALLMVYGIIINPIRAWKEKNKKVD